MRLHRSSIIHITQSISKGLQPSANRAMKSETIFLVLVAYLSCHHTAESSTRPLLSSKNQDLVGGSSDPFVSSAPLIVASECSDGVALLALHSAFAEEPLLLDAEDEDVASPEISPVKEELSIEKNDSLDDTNAQNSTTVDITDVPRSYRGPFRIHSIDSFGTAMLCAGWRSHAQLMADYSRDLAKEELQIYGEPRMTLAHCQEYGSYLSEQTSLWMAYTGVMQRYRWSNVGLLATCSSSKRETGDNPSISNPGCLWLVDQTGTYRVRAHAVGGGKLSGIVNQYLADEMSKNGQTKKAEETLRDLIKFLSQQYEFVAKGTRVELAILAASGGKTAKLNRVFASRIIDRSP